MVDEMLEVWLNLKLIKSLINILNIDKIFARVPSTNDIKEYKTVSTDAWKSALYVQIHKRLKSFQ